MTDLRIHRRQADPQLARSLLDLLYINAGGFDVATAAMAPAFPPRSAPAKRRQFACYTFPIRAVWQNKNRRCIQIIQNLSENGKQSGNRRHISKV